MLYRIEFRSSFQDHSTHKSYSNMRYLSRRESSPLKWRAGSVPPSSGDASDALCGEKNNDVLRKVGMMFRLWFTQDMASEREGVCLNELAPEVQLLTLEKVCKTSLDQ
jgi:hypothetical protein